MSMMEGIKNKFRVDAFDEDDEDFDEFDDVDEFEDDEESSGGFFRNLFKRKHYDDDYEEDDDFEDPRENSSYKRSASSSANADYAPRTAQDDRRVSGQGRGNTRTGGARVIPMSRAMGNTGSMPKKSSELYMIKPKTEEDARIAVDHLLNGEVVIINLEGLNLEIAQYVTDFVTGANYSIGGNFNTINSQVLVFAPPHVEMTGAFSDGQFDNLRDF